MSKLLKSQLLNLLFFIVMLTGQAKAKDYGGPYRPYSSELENGGGRIFLGWDEAAFAKLSIENVQLKQAYAKVFGSADGVDLYSVLPELQDALADMRRRGDTVTPMLLKLMSENQETGFESNVLVNIASVGTISLEPYLEYARRVLRERTTTMSAGLAGCAASLLRTHGTKEDAELLRWVIEMRPFLADSVIRELDGLNRRLGLPQQNTRPMLRDSYSVPGAFEEGSQRDSKKVSIPNEEKPLHAPTRLLWVLLPLGLLVLLWLNVKSHKPTKL